MHIRGASAWREVSNIRRLFLLALLQSPQRRAGQIKHSKKEMGAPRASPEDIKKVQLKHGKPKRGRTLEYAPAGSGPSFYLINILSDISTPRQSKGVSRTTDPSPSPSASYSFTEENSISLDTHHICLPRARLSSLKERPEQLLQLISNCAAQGIQGMDCS
jgi:hypothetical protein